MRPSLVSAIPAMALAAALFSGLAAAQPEPSTAAPDPFAACREGLASPRTMDRVRALNELGQKPPQGTEAFLADYLDDPDEQVRRGVLDLLARLGTPAAIAQIDRALASASGERRLEAVRSIASAPGVPVDERLVRATRDEDPAIAAAAVAALRERDARGHVDVFLSVLERSPDHGVRKGAILALQQAAAPEAVPALSEVAWTDRYLAPAATEALSSIGTPEAVDTLVALVSPPEGRATPSTKTRESAVYGLRLAPRSDATRALLGLALAPGGPDEPAGENEALRSLALESARRHPLSPEQAAAVVPLLDAATPLRVRQAALRLLRDHAPDAGFGRARSIALDASEPSDVRTWAVQVVAASAAEEATPTLTALATVQDPVLLAVLVEALAPRVEDDRVVEALLGLAGSAPDPAAASAALAALEGRARPEHLDALGRIVTSPDALVRAALGPVLGRLGTPRALEPLGRLAEDGDPFVRRAAAEGLGTLGLPEGRDLLNRLRRDPDDGVRRAARSALEKLPAQG